MFCKKPILQYYDISKQDNLFTDANNYAYSGILAQSVYGPGDLRSIAYTLGSFFDIQQRWSATEKEAFAVYKPVLKFDSY